MIKNSIIYPESERRSHLGESSSKPWCCSSVRCTERVQLCVLEGGYFLPHFWEHRPQPVSITSLAPYCPSIFPRRRSCPSQQGKDSSRCGISRWVSLRFQLGQQFTESPHSRETAVAGFAMHEKAKFSLRKSFWELCVLFLRISTIQQQWAPVKFPRHLTWF